MPQIIEHPLASDSQDGYLSREDWATFNSLFSSSTIDPGHKHSKLWASDGSPEAVTVNAAGLVGVRTASPTASLHLPAGVAAASGAPLKFTPGTNLTAPENGTMEYDGTDFYLTAGGVRQTIGFAIGMDHGGLAGLGDDDHTQYLLASGSRALSGDWDIGAGRKISAEAIYARSNLGLKLFEDGGAGIFVQDVTGNVGIGTTSPDSKLHLSSSATTSDILAQFFASGMADNNYIDLYLGKSRGTDLAGTISFVPQAVAANSYLLFGLYGTTGPLIVGKNNVGIGTTSPGKPLDVSGDIRSSSQFISTVATGTAPLAVNSTTAVANLNADLLDGNHAADFALLSGRAGGQTLIGGTGSGENLTLQSSSHATRGKIIFGNSAYDEVNDRLGLGTTSPGTRLDLVTGNITARSLFSSATNDYTGISGGSGPNLGANMVCYGQSHATLANVILWRNATTNLMKLDGDANLSIGNIALGTSAAKVLGFEAGTAPTTAPANIGQMWVEDINGAAGYAGLHKMTETTAQKEIVVGYVIKETTGDPSNPYPGLFCENKYDNTLRVYTADVGWRTIDSW